MTVSPEPWTTPPKVAAALGIKPDRVIALIRSGTVQALDVRRPGSTRPRYRLKLSDVEKVLAVRPDPPRPAIRQRKQDGKRNVIEFFLIGVFALYIPFAGSVVAGTSDPAPLAWRSLEGGPSDNQTSPLDVD